MIILTSETFVRWIDNSFYISSLTRNYKVMLIPFRPCFILFIDTHASFRILYNYQVILQMLCFYFLFGFINTIIFIVTLCTVISVLLLLLLLSLQLLLPIFLLLLLLILYTTLTIGPITICKWKVPIVRKN